MNSARSTPRTPTSAHGATIRKILPEWGKNNKPLRLHELFDAAFARQDQELKFVAPVQPFIMNERLAVQQGMFYVRLPCS
jgi:hypothetical protein